MADWSLERAASWQYDDDAYAAGVLEWVEAGALLHRHAYDGDELDGEEAKILRTGQHS
jgi:hypothetical protein